MSTAPIRLHRPGELSLAALPPLSLYVHIESLGRSVADLDAATKNAHSHRALAAARMRELMNASWFAG